MPLFRRFSKKKTPSQPRTQISFPVPASMNWCSGANPHVSDPPSYRTDPPSPLQYRDGAGSLFQYRNAKSRASGRSSRYEDPNPYAQSYRLQEGEREEMCNWEDQRHAGAYREEELVYSWEDQRQQHEQEQGRDPYSWQDQQAQEREQEQEPDPYSWSYQEEKPTVPASFPYHQDQDPNPYPSYPHQQQQQPPTNPIPSTTEPAQSQPHQQYQPPTNPFVSQTSTPTSKKPDSLHPLPSQIPRLTAILAANPSDPLQAHLIRNLPFPLKLPSAIRKRLFADTTFCAAHAAISPPYVYYLLDLLGAELWPRLRRLLSSPLTLSACTQTFLDAVRKWRPFFRPEDIGQPGRPCGVCALGAFWRDENAREAVGMLARGRKKKGRGFPEIVAFVGEGVDGRGRVEKGWRKGAVWDVLHDRKMVRRWESGEDVMGVEGPREKATSRWRQTWDGELAEGRGGRREIVYEGQEEYGQREEYGERGEYEKREEWEEWEAESEGKSVEEPYVDSTRQSSADNRAHEYQKIFDAYGD